ncbi:MAG: DUF2811 domain-containing protein [Verrucomicrobia bacterium]|nr:DUF2811 domain-containing protein [Leptolyngbya sp. ES-bin-22]
MPPDTNVCFEAEIPEELHDRIKTFLEANPALHYNDFVTAALSLLLMQISEHVSPDPRRYLDRIFHGLEKVG